MSYKYNYVSMLRILSTAIALVLALPLVMFGQSAPRMEEPSPRLETRTQQTTTATPGSTIQLRVECGNPAARVKTIADGLKLLGALHPAVLLISGTCHENVVIQGLDSITLQGNPTATIDGGSDPNLGTVAITGSQIIALNNLTITGGGEGVGCIGASFCVLTQVTIQNGLGNGANVGRGAHLDITDSVIQNNAAFGLGIGVGSAAFFGGSITGNGSDGVSMRNGSFFGTGPGDVIPNVTIQNNAGNGIRTILRNTISLGSAVITGNALDGVTLQMGSSMRMFDSSITNNGGHQVRIGDLSMASFAPGTVTGANYPDVVCDPLFSTTRNLRSLILRGATTNCPAELPPTP